ncbi:LapA family protein [Tepidiforma sp.]|uniref:LapA family protein n=1 Tax=Tepidiforma sp. TaxID=2682230 RepID=UPI002ADE372D|nr:LapA family protein [Tepidiforma sp.]
MTAAPQSESKWRVRLVVLALVVVALVVFIAENWLTVEVRFLFAKTETRLAWALIVAALLGYAAGWLTPKLRR